MPDLPRGRRDGGETGARSIESLSNAMAQKELRTLSDLVQQCLSGQKLIRKDQLTLSDTVVNVRQSESQTSTLILDLRDLLLCKFPRTDAKITC